MPAVHHLKANPGVDPGVGRASHAYGRLLWMHSPVRCAQTNKDRVHLLQSSKGPRQARAEPAVPEQCRLSQHSSATVGWKL